MAMTKMSSFNRRCATTPCADSVVDIIDALHIACQFVHHPARCSPTNSHLYSAPPLPFVPQEIEAARARLPEPPVPKKE